MRSSGEAVSRSPAHADAPGRDAFDQALALATAGRGITFVAMSAPVVAAASLVRGWPGSPVVAWSSPATDTTSRLTIVGLGCAREIRGSGPERWAQLVARAAKVAIHGAINLHDVHRLDSRPSARIDERRFDARPETVLAPIGSLGVARPRFLGGAAFSPGAADRSPWTGFGDAWFVLPRWTYTSDGATARLVLALDEVDARDPVRWRAELARVEQLLAAPTHDNNHDYAITDRAASSVAGARVPSASHVVAAASPDLWRTQVEAITSAIAAGTCSKIVAARTCTVSLDPRGSNDLELPEHDLRSRGSRELADAAREPRSDLDLAATAPVLVGDLFDALEARHPDCVRLLIRPSGGALVAATPERLVRRDGDTIACDALAGTIRSNLVGPLDGRSNLVGPLDDRSNAGETDAAGTLLASTKDRREHDLVVTAIRDALTELGATIDAPPEPRIKRLRHVLHLHTPFRATTTSPRHVLELVARLHPTPAVGGTPTQLAIDWIRDHEPVPRGWYASPVGWFDLDGNGDFAVAIRSGVVAGDRVHLWAGAGIVAGSDPDRELAETELKLRAMLGALGVSS